MRLPKLSLLSSKPHLTRFNGLTLWRWVSTGSSTRSTTTTSHSLVKITSPARHKKEKKRTAELFPDARHYRPKPASSSACGTPCNSRGRAAPWTSCHAPSPISGLSSYICSERGAEALGSGFLPWVLRDRAIRARDRIVIRARAQKNAPDADAGFGGWAEGETGRWGG